MSSSIYWRPTKNPGNSVDKAIWSALMTYRGLGDAQKIEIGEDDTPALRAFAIAGVSGAKELLEAIEKHEAIEVEQRW